VRAGVPGPGSTGNGVHLHRYAGPVFAMRRDAAADAAGLTAFAAVGAAAHGGLSLLGSGAATLACLLGCWFGLAALLGSYRTRARARTAAVWAAGVPLAVLLRALVLGRPLDGREAAFLATSLVFTAVFVAAARLAAGRIARRYAGDVV
jgi:hypothetical protein